MAFIAHDASPIPPQPRIGRSHRPRPKEVRNGTAPALTIRAKKNQLQMQLGFQLVEAAGIEPASENDPSQVLHA